MAETLKPTLIVVDDDPDMAALISLAAQSTGFNVRRADSAATFINFFNENEPSAIVMVLSCPTRMALN